MTKYTPGPWTHVGFAVVQPLSAKANGSRIAAQCFGPDGEANARLIAAAPDLLDMCERLLGFAHHYAHESALAAGEGMLANAKALIAQAKGGAV